MRERGPNAGERCSTGLAHSAMAFVAFCHRFRITKMIVLLEQLLGEKKGRTGKATFSWTAIKA